MQLAVSMIIGVSAGAVLFSLLRVRPSAMAWTALVMGLLGSALFIASISGWALPELGRFGIIGIGMISGIATALAVGSLMRGERHAQNWAALAVSAPPLLFMLVFGIAELIGPRH